VGRSRRAIGTTGRLVEPGDAEALARAIAATLDDEGETQRMVETARRHVESHYSIERTVERYHRLFDEVMIA
jgi:glycosyltransferase involved in cell wall biosynthesis